MRATAERTPSPDVRHLEEVADTIEAMLCNTAQRDLSGVFEAALRALHGHLSAEDVCLLYLNPETKSNRLARLASFGDRDEFQMDMWPVARGGLCESLFRRDQIQNLSGESLRHLFETLPRQPAPSYLASKQTFSVLAVPLHDRKGRPTLLLKASNKKGPAGPGPDLAFTAEDVQTARVVGLALATHFDYTNTFRAVQYGVQLLTAGVDEDQGAEDISKLLATAAQRVTKADDVKFFPCDGHDPECLSQPDGAAVPEKLLRRALADGDRLCREDVGGTHRLAVAVGQTNNRWGVLYLETGHQRGFDARDDMTIRWLTAQAEGALRVHRTVADRLSRAADPSAQRTAAEQILEAAGSVWGFEKGALYLADEEARKLSCAAASGWEREHGIEEFPAYNFADPRVIPTVYTTGKSARATVSKDRGAGRSDPAPFDPGSTVVAVPLTHEERPLGVLAMGGGDVDGLDDLVPTRREQAFAALASAHLANARGVAPAAEELTDPVRAEQLRDTVLAARKSGGFDRVRLFAYEGTHQRFLPVDCLGMNRQWFLTRAVIRIAATPYAKDLVDTCAAGPRRYGPGTDRDFGPDPDRNVLEKPDGLPWAVAPILRGGHLLGQVVADNERTRRPITDEALEALQVEAGRAAEWLKGRGWPVPVSLAGLRLLHQWVGKSSARHAVTKRLLAYLTCGDALGFSRALFLAPDESEKKLVYRSGTGSIARANFEQIGNRTRTMELEDVLRAAPDTDDGDIAEALFDLTIEIDAEERNLFLTAQFHEIEVESPSPWKAKLAREFESERVATVPVRRDEKLLGLFIVDRRWQDRAVGRHDVAVLQRFAVEAATILTDRERAHTAKANPPWDRALAHACGGGLIEIAGRVENILGHADWFTVPPTVDALTISREAARKIRDNVLKVKKVADDLTRVVHPIKKMANPGDQPKVAGVMQALRQDSVLQQFKEHNVKYEARPKTARGGAMPEVKVAINPDILTWVIDELARNACRALHRWENPEDPFDYFFQPNPEVKVDLILRTSEPIPEPLDPHTRYALILFTDNGKGVDWNLQGKIFDPGCRTRSSREQGGSGLGLTLVRQAIEANHGYIGFFSEPGGGTTFYLYLPLTDEGAPVRFHRHEEGHP
jgi:signal transduction histidine kinase